MGWKTPDAHQGTRRKGPQNCRKMRSLEETMQGPKPARGLSGPAEEGDGTGRKALQTLLALEGECQKMRMEVG